MPLPRENAARGRDVDAIALQTLREEMLEDRRAASEAFAKAAARFERKEEVAYGGYAHQLCRTYKGGGAVGRWVGGAVGR